jgi:cellulose 1,4-beta-cellobiosidase
MIRTKPVLGSLFVLAAALGGATAPGLSGITGAGAAAKLCQYGTAAIDGGAYTVQNDEYGSSAAECVAAGTGTSYSVVSSAISNPTGNAPGAYPSVYQGCAYGTCTGGGLGKAPLRLSSIRAGEVTSTWHTAQPYQSGEAYDVSYDIWVSPTAARTSGAVTGSEIMVWLNRKGGVVPAGTEVARHVTIGGRVYGIWYNPRHAGASDTVSYVMATPETSVTNLDLDAVLRDSVGRGYTSPGWYLTAVEAGFELWHGGAGLKTTSFGLRS